MTGKNEAMSHTSTDQQDQPPSPAAIRKMANDALRYLMSPEGQMRLREGKEERERLVEQFRKMRDVPHELLHRAFTI